MSARALVPDRFADLTDLTTVDGVAIRVWLTEDGGVVEERQHRASTRVLQVTFYESTSEPCQIYRSLIKPIKPRP